MKKIIKFTIEGKFAIFKKYYSNKNALSYYIPPRTSIIGLLASILEFDRDSYYEVFNTENLKVAIEINKPLKTMITSINHLSSKSSGNGRRQVAHTLILPVKDKISYNIYLQMKDKEMAKKLLSKLENNDYGYGIYFGQRQFLAYITDFDEIENYEVLSETKCILNSAINSENVCEIKQDNECIIIKDVFPIDFTKIKKGREPLKYSDIVYEQNGKGIEGVFKNIINFDNRNISFIN